MPNPSAPGTPARGAANLAAALRLLPVLIVLALFAADHLPRFMQGDSVSYLMTSAAWMPPDRSWAFGFGAGALLEASRSYVTYILLNCALLVAVAVQCRALAGGAGGAWGNLLAAACAIAVAADPLTEAYARFYLSDFWGMGCFVILTGTLAAYLRGGAHGWALLAASFALTIGAVFIRLAYAPVILLAACLMLAWSCRCGPAAMRWRAAASALLPVAAVGALLGCNAVLFAQQLPGPPFVNRISGTLLMGVFAPALSQKDFAHAGIPMTDQEHYDLHLDDYDKRISQVWGGKGYLRELIMDKLGDHDEYSVKVDKACMAVVSNAFKRKPSAFAKVYLRTLALYFSVAEWRKFFVAESGADRPLEGWFVDSFNSRAATRIYPNIVKEPSATLSLYRAAVPLYPALLALCSAAAAFILLSRRSSVTEATVAAAFLAALAAAPLYSNYAIPRYVLPCVALGYVLIALLLRRALDARPVRTPQPAWANRPG